MDEAEREEPPQRALGFSLGGPRQGPPRPHRDRNQAQQYAMGLPAEWFGQVDVEFFHRLVHPLRWWRHRQDRPEATGDDPR